MWSRPKVTRREYAGTRKGAERLKRDMGWFASTSKDKDRTGKGRYGVGLKGFRGEAV